MKALVTGATGFVGSHLCDRLVAEGHEVIALARASSRTSHLEKPGVTVLRGGLDDPSAYRQIAAGLDVVFHLAGLTKALEPKEFVTVNARMTAAFVSGLAEAGFCGRLVNLSSLAAGGPAGGPNAFRRMDDGDSPVSDYGRSKLAGEHAVKARLKPPATWTVLRPGAIYGPRERDIYEILRLINGLGVAVRVGPGVVTQMTHVDDVVSAMMLAGCATEAAGKTYYVVEATPWSFDEVIELVGRVLGRRVRVLGASEKLAGRLAAILERVGRWRGKPVSPLSRDKLAELGGRYWVADASPLEEELGWRVRWRLEEGLAATVEWYRQEGWL